MCVPWSHAVEIRGQLLWVLRIQLRSAGLGSRYFTKWPPCQPKNVFYSCLVLGFISSKLYLPIAFKLAIFYQFLILGFSETNLAKYGRKGVGLFCTSCTLAVLPWGGADRTKHSSSDGGRIPICWRLTRCQWLSLSAPSQCLKPVQDICVSWPPSSFPGLLQCRWKVR